MPWTEKQKAVARAVEHGWKPKGSAAGFTRSLADLITSEAAKAKTKKKK